MVSYMVLWPHENKRLINPSQKGDLCIDSGFRSKWPGVESMLPYMRTCIAMVEIGRLVSCPLSLSLIFGGFVEEFYVIIV
jgi:hypothetical protein